MRVHHEKEQRGEFTITKRDGVRVHYEKKSPGVRVDHEKKGDGVRVEHEKKSAGLRVYHKKEQWGKSSPQEGAMG